MAKALLLFSGGLDSLLAYKTLEAQGIEVVPIFFKTYFFSQEKAEEIAQANDIKLRVEDISEDHLKIVKKPKFGYGRRRNPCVDCHLLMIKKAKQIMEREGFDFVATGDVLGQRPMSQNAAALERIEKEAGLEGKILRPLSAKLLPKTEVEEKGMIDREKMLDIRGRGRERQLDLVWKLGITKYQSPAGGCLLTDPAFSDRLSGLVERWPDYNQDDVALLRTGRIFWHGKNLIVVARNKDECEKITQMAKSGDYLIDFVIVPGPTALVRGRAVDDETIAEAIELLIKYAHKTEGMASIKMRVRGPGGEEMREISKKVIR